MSADLPSFSPVCVSQLNCLSAYGVTPTWYLKHANDGDFRTWRAGKLVLSLPSDFLAWLQSLPPGAREGADGPLPDVLGELGLGRKAG